MAAIAPVNLGALNFKQCFADILVGSVFYIFLLALDFKSLCNSKNKPHAILYNIKILNMPCSDQTSQVSEIIYLNLIFVIQERASSLGVAVHKQMDLLQV